MIDLRGLKNSIKIFTAIKGMQGGSGRVQTNGNAKINHSFNALK